MPFTLFQIPFINRGVVLVGSPDRIPDNAMRLGTNVRFDRLAGNITSRPGWSLLSASAIGAGQISWLGKLYSSTDYSYVHSADGEVYRCTDTWGSATSIVTAGTATIISDANLVDGEGGLWKYIVNGAIAYKDNGTNIYAIGISPPTNPPTSVALATDLSTSISTMDSAAAWTGSGLASGPADETNIKIEGTGSVTFSLAASSIGSIADGFAGNTDLDTLTGGDDTVKDDDYIHFWLRVDRPDYVDYIQVDFDLDTTTVANAFRTNYYSVRLSSQAWLNQGRDQWTKIQVRKSEFVRFGTSTSVDWSTTKAVRISAATNSLGTATFYVDDLKLRGGVSLEGEIEYTVCYRNSATGARGNPPKDSDYVVQYTSKLETDRQRIQITTSNIISGGADHPGDAQIDKIMIFRKGGNFDAPVLVDTIDDTTASPYTDSTSDETLLLNPEYLEDDNDTPPTGTTRVLFGPDSQGRLYMIVDGHRLYFAKAFEDGESRGENWPRLQFALIGDGSQQALAGIATDTEVFVWDERQTFRVVGYGADTLIPVPIPDSRGIIGQFAATSGSGRIFFVAPDGIYQQVGIAQQKLTGAIDPFFNGETVDGQPPMSTTASVRALTRLKYYADPHGPFLCMTYADSANTTPNAYLVVKQNPETGQFTEVLFNSSALTNLVSLMVDDEDRQLIAGAADGNVYLIEDHSANTDNGTAIAGSLRTKSYDHSSPERQKHVSDFLIEGDTADVNLTATAYYDRSSNNESLGTFKTTNPTEIDRLSTSDPTAKRHDVALDLSWSSSSLITIARIGWHHAFLSESRAFYDTDDLSYPFVIQIKRIDFEIDAPGNIALVLYVAGAQRYTYTILATSGRQTVQVPIVAGLKGKTWRMTLSATLPFEVYNSWAWTKPVGSLAAYQQQQLLQVS